MEAVPTTTPAQGPVTRGLRAFVGGEVLDAPPREDQRDIDEWEPTPGRIGVCCSGGGIRSASYSLGALQALQDRGVLRRATYLAAVSGGAYAAGALTMLAASPDQDAVWGPDVPPPFARGTPEEDHLRRHSSYLAPGLGGKVRLLSRLLLGLAINLLALGAVIVITARLCGQLAAWLQPDLVVGSAGGAPTPAFVGGSATVTTWLAGIGFGLLLLTAALRLDEVLHRGLVTASTLLLAIAGTWALLVFGVPWLLEVSRGMAGILGDALGWVAERVTEEAGTDAAGSGPPGTDVLSLLLAIAVATGVPALLGGALRAIATDHASRLALAAAWLVAPALVAITFVAVADDAAAAGPGFTAANLLWLGSPAAVLLFLYAFSDLTAWSMHPFYKRRLSSAFALERYSVDGAGRRTPAGQASPDDGRLAARERDYDRPVPLSSTVPPAGSQWPKLVVCAAANVSDPNVTPPGRNAVSFTFEHDRIGSPEIGYLSTRRFEQLLGPSRRQDTTLPAAIAISGAALSPSMGKMTLPSLRFLLALVNARLGVWLPNPAYVLARHARQAEQEARRLQRRQPDATAAQLDAEADDPAQRRIRALDRPRLPWLFREMLGLNGIGRRYLYVTDGGHWENLGLVELLRRGCTEIYCIDAAGDERDTFFTIGEAIALARSELGVEIELDPTPMRPPPAAACPAACSPSASPSDGDGDGDDDAAAGGAGATTYAPVDSVVGSFTYPAEVLPSGDVRPAMTGRLVFVKAAVTATDAWDVRAYKERDPAFPNHSLLAQMFADETFESYRKLGYDATTRAVERAT